VPTNELGSPIAREHYRLVIDRDWHDAQGARLVEVLRRRSLAGHSSALARSEALEPDAPKAGTVEPLVVEFLKRWITRCCRG